MVDCGLAILGVHMINTSRRAFLKGASSLAGVAVLSGCSTLGGGNNVTASAPQIDVYRHPLCLCCNDWMSHLRKAGFQVNGHYKMDMEAVKVEHSVPLSISSCHTAVVNGYVVEGHVPATDILRLLDEKPVAQGLSLPAMPVGSPGMEDEHGHKEHYKVLLFNKDGSYSVYAEHN